MTPMLESQKYLSLTSITFAHSFRLNVKMTGNTSFLRNIVPLFMKPFTVALDILGEDTCFYGTLQPILEVLMNNILATKHGLSQMTTGQPEVIVGAIKTSSCAG